MMKINHDTQEHLSPLLWAIGTILSILIYIAILINRIPIPFRQIAISVRYGFAIPITAIGLILFFCLKIKSRFGELLTLLLVLAVFAFALAGVWAGGKSTPMAINGLIPIVDAEMYYNDALRLLNGGVISSVAGGYKALFTIYLAGILSITGYSLQITLAVMTFVAALGCFLTINNFNRLYGVLPATIIFLLIFLFSRIHIGNVSSELLGIPIGLIGFTLLIARNNSEKQHATFWGYFFLSLALNIRPGAYFILPALCVYQYFIERKPQILQIVTRCLIPILLGFLINFILSTLLVSKNNPFIGANYFIFMLYGLARGGSGWTQIFTNHPEILSLPSSDWGGKILSMSINEIINEPGKLIAGIFKQFILFFNPAELRKNVFSYVNPETNWLAMLLQIMLVILLIFALYKIIRSKEKKMFIYVAAFIGILATLPIIPIQDFNYLRPNAAVIGWIVALPAFGIMYLQKQLVFQINNEKVKPLQLKNGFLIFSLLVLLPFAAFPFLIKENNAKSSFDATACTSDFKPISFNLYPDSRIIIRPEMEFFLDWMPVFHRGRFLQNIRFFDYSEFVEPLINLKPPFLLTAGIDLNEHRNYFFVIQDESLFDQTGMVQCCGKPIQYLNSPINWQLYLSPLLICQTAEIIK